MKLIGRGSVIPRENKPKSRCRVWQLQQVVEDGGERKRPSRTYHGTWTQAQDALDAFRDELSEVPITSDMPFAEWCDLWCRRRAQSLSYSTDTLDNDRNRTNAARMHLHGSVGDVTGDDVRKMYVALSQGSTPSGRPWSAKSLEGMHKTLTTLFGDAFKSRVIANNPMNGVQCPKVPKKRYTVISSPQMDNLLDSLDYSDGAQRAVALCAACGLRRKEAVELEWRDLGTSLEVVDAKTDAGSRSVPVPAHILARLEPYRSDGRVSGLSDPHSLTRWWARHRDELGCQCTLHDLRRSWATRLAEAGVHPRVMMELGGWDSIDVCMEVYTHVSSQAREDAIRAAFVQRDGSEKENRPEAISP